MSKKQTICLHIGQAGVQLGNAIWELICIEHGIKINGSISQQYINSISSTLSFFYSLNSQKNRFAPRSLFVDTETMVIDEIRTGSYKHLFPSKTMISGLEDAANLYPRGYCTAGRNILTPTLEAIRFLYESSNNLHGIILFRSCGGGSGSGATTLFLNKIEDNFSKVNVSEFMVIPAPCISTSIVEPYNTVLTLFQSQQNIDLTIFLDNQALYEISKFNLDILQPSYFNINKIVANAVSSLTASIRFDSVLYSDFNIFQTNLIPYPNFKFPIISYAPIISISKRFSEPQTIFALTEEVFERKNFLVKCFPEYGEYMACAILYRGKNCGARDISQAAAKIKKKPYIKFVDWCPTGFKIGISRQPPPFVQYSCLGKVSRAVCLLSNSTCISQVFDYILQKYDILYKRKAYVHWFTGESLEEAELVEAREGVMKLLLNYLQYIEVKPDS